MGNCIRNMLLTSLVTLVALLVLPVREARAEPVNKSVRVLYLVPKDRERRKDYQSAIETCVLDLQTWYYGHLKGKTFRLNDPIVEVKRTPHDASWYDSNVPANRPEKKFYTWYNALDDASALLGAKADDPDYVWLIYIDAPGGTGAGVNGVAILPEHDLQGLIGKAADKTPVRRWIGGSGHELGHGFGLPHPGNLYPTALMEGGYANYPACHLTPKDTATLNKSSFLHAGRPDTFKGRGRFIYAYDGGYFINVGGNNWEERKAGSDTMYYFKQNGGEKDFIHLLDASREPGAWIALPKEGSGNNISFMWQGESWKKLYEAVE